MYKHDALSFMNGTSLSTYHIIVHVWAKLDRPHVATLLICTLLVVFSVLLHSFFYFDFSIISNSSETHSWRIWFICFWWVTVNVMHIYWCLPTFSFVPKASVTPVTTTSYTSNVHVSSLFPSSSLPTGS